MIEYKDAKNISDALRQRIIDKIEISDSGATITPVGKKLSNGCYACKSGQWICIYIGVSCNLKCASCPQVSRHGVEEFIWANGGNDDIHSLDDLKRVIYKNPRITGLSFSGGEPFMYLDKVYEWLDFINENFSQLNLYLWIYTNGVLVTEEECIKLRDKGIKEIRFDLAATNYSDKTIDKIVYCKKIFEKICVEVPSEFWQVDKLISVLPRLNEIGLDYLNLHELSVNQDNLPALRKKGINEALLYCGHYLPSIFDTYRVIEYIENNKLNIIYNDCSSRNMTMQMLGWQFQRNKQNDQFSWEPWEDFLIRAEGNGHTP